MTDILELASALRYQRHLYRLPMVRRPRFRAGMMVTGQHIAGVTYGVMAFVTLFHSYERANSTEVYSVVEVRIADRALDHRVDVGVGMKGAAHLFLARFVDAVEIIPQRFGDFVEWLVHRSLPVSKPAQPR